MLIRVNIIVTNLIFLYSFEVYVQKVGLCFLENVLERKEIEIQGVQKVSAFFCLFHFLHVFIENLCYISFVRMIELRAGIIRLFEQGKKALK